MQEKAAPPALQKYLEHGLNAPLEMQVITKNWRDF